MQPRVPRPYALAVPTGHYPRKTLVPSTWISTLSTAEPLTGLAVAGPGRHGAHSI